MQTILST